MKDYVIACEQWTKRMLDNPFRVFSVPADISIEELDEKIEDMRNELQVFGEADEQELEYDLEGFPLPERSVEKLSIAQMQLQESAEIYRMFWFADAQYCKNWTNAKAYEERIREIPDASNYDAFLVYFLHFLTVQDCMGTFLDTLPVILRYMEHLKEPSCFRNIYLSRNPEQPDMERIQNQLLEELDESIFQVISNGRKFGECIEDVKKWENQEFASYIINDWCTKWMPKWEQQLKQYKDNELSMYQEKQPGSPFVQKFEYVYHGIYQPVRNICVLWNHTEYNQLYCDSALEIGILYQNAMEQYKETGEESLRSDLEYMEKNLAAENALAEHIVMCYKERQRRVHSEVAKWAKLGADYGIYYMLDKYLEACFALQDYKEVLRYTGKFRSMNQRLADLYEGDARIRLGDTEDGEKILKSLSDGEDDVAWEALRALSMKYIRDAEPEKAACCYAGMIFLDPEYKENYDLAALGLFLKLGTENPEWMAFLMQKFTQIPVQEDSDEIGVLRELGYDYDFTKKEIVGDGSSFRNTMILRAKCYDFAVLAGRLEEAVYKTEKQIQEGKEDYRIYERAFYLRERRIFGTKQTAQEDLEDHRIALQWLEKALERMPQQEDRRLFENFREMVLGDVKKLEMLCRLEEEDPYKAYQGFTEYYKNVHFLLGQDAALVTTEDKLAYYKEKLQKLEEAQTRREAQAQKEAQTQQDSRINQKQLSGMTMAQKKDYINSLIEHAIMPDGEWDRMSNEQQIAGLKQDIRYLYEAERVILSEEYLLRTIDTDHLLETRNRKIKQLHMICGTRKE